MLWRLPLLYVNTWAKLIGTAEATACATDKREVMEDDELDFDFEQDLQPQQAAAAAAHSGPGGLVQHLIQVPMLSAYRTQNTFAGEGLA